MQSRAKRRSSWVQPNKVLMRSKRQKAPGEPAWGKETVHIGAAPIFRTRPSSTYPLVHSNCYGSSPTHKLLFMSAIILPESGMNSAFCSVASALWSNRGEDIIGERYPMTWAEQWINEHYSTRAWARMRLEAASYGTT